ncbi:MAG: sulfotransferase [Paracoccaceae bacterium]
MSRETMPETPPVVIGGVGGSGTRAFCEMFLRGGYAMGDKLNASLDSNVLAPVINGTLNSVLARAGRVDFSCADLPAAVIDPVIGQTRGILDSFATAVPPGQTRWGMKQPRTILMLPIIEAVWPDFKFIHVIRDGRDMALSKNQNQVRFHYSALIEGRPAAYSPSPFARFAKALGIKRRMPVGIDKSIRWWSKINSEAADWGEARGSRRYLRIKFEDLIMHPAEILGQVESFTGEDMPQDAIAHIIKPSSVGRARRTNSRIRQRIEQLGAPVLGKFGYGAGGSAG